MKERLLTFALAIGALALFYALGAPPSDAQRKPTRPVSTERGPNGYAALLHWLEAEGARPVSLRERYGSLNGPKSDAPRRGNLLISTAPHLYPVRKSEVDPLRDWIAEGNTLLIVAGLSDTPDWSMGEGQDADFMTHMLNITGLSFTQVPDPAAEKPASTPEQPASEEKPAREASPAQQSTVQRATDALRKLVEPQKFELVPNGPHPLLEGVKSVRALSEYPTGKWRAASEAGDLVLELAQDPATGDPVLWLLRVGQGQIILSAYGSILTNKLLGGADNARLLANIVKWSTEPGGKVLIDDAHQGLVAYYDPDAFFGDKRLHASLGWLLALWLVFVLGPQRLRAAESRWRPVDITSFVRASGGFLARVLKPAAAGQRLFENFFNDIRRHAGLPANGAPMWDWMSAHGTVDDNDVARLQELHGKVLRGQRIDVSKLQNLLVQIRRGLL